ncbi:REP-associated tyrosine transposase [Labrys okinawensis]|uniref:REP-associated tyrosine transposase n=1 Tax=Labrys okinawensis TaxID=346911 RepID=UPI0039BCF4B7
MTDEQPRSPLKPQAEWHSRGYLPHWEAGEEAQAIFFRLADSMPRHLRERWATELRHLPDDAKARESRKRIEAFLDAGHGEAFLSKEAIGPIIEGSLLHFDAERYRLHAWCVMPNHVHVLITPIGDHSLSSIIHSWKSFTAKKLNVALGRTGQVWFEEYFDRKIRSEKHFEDARYYIEQNPVKAGLCKDASEWRYSSTSRSRSCLARADVSSASF